MTAVVDMSAVGVGFVGRGLRHFKQTVNSLNSRKQNERRVAEWQAGTECVRVYKADDRLVKSIDAKVNQTTCEYLA